MSRASTLPAAAKIPATLRARVMGRAWEIFRKSYNYPRVPLRLIGRACFAWALKSAWAETREIARLATLGVAELKAAAVAVVAPSHRVGLSTSYSDSPTVVFERYRRAAAYMAAIPYATAA